MRYILAILLAVSFGCGYFASNTEIVGRSLRKLGVGHKAQKAERQFADFEVYDPQRNASQAIYTALTRAKQTGHKVIIAMGANWCHDSRGFAAQMARPAFQTLLAHSYEIVYVSVGTELGQKDQNADIAARFGQAAITGTPTVYILDAKGRVLNRASATYWRHAATIPDDMSLAYLKSYAEQ